MKKEVVIEILEEGIPLRIVCKVRSLKKANEKHKNDVLRKMRAEQEGDVLKDRRQKSSGRRVPVLLEEPVVHLCNGQHAHT